MPISNVGAVLNAIRSVSRPPFSSERLLPHLNQRRHSHRKPSHRISSFVLQFKVLYQMYLPCYCLLAEKIAVHPHSTLFSPAVCFPTTSCMADSNHKGLGRVVAAILEAVVHANVCLMSSQRMQFIFLHCYFIHYCLSERGTHTQTLTCTEYSEDTQTCRRSGLQVSPHLYVA